MCMSFYHRIHKREALNLSDFERPYSELAGFLSFSLIKHKTIIGLPGIPDLQTPCV